MKDEQVSPPSLSTCVAASDSGSAVLCACDFRAWPVCAVSDGRFLVTGEEGILIEESPQTLPDGVIVCFFKSHDEGCSVRGSYALRLLLVLHYEVMLDAPSWP